MIVRFPLSESVLIIELEILIIHYITDVVGSSSYIVLDTDYDNYAMVCTCQVRVFLFFFLVLSFFLVLLCVFNHLLYILCFANTCTNANVLPSRTWTCSSLMPTVSLAPYCREDQRKIQQSPTR